MTYEKQVWVDGETVNTRARMEHIEDGVEAAHLAIEVTNANIAAVEGEVDGLEADLAIVATASEDNAAEISGLETSMDSSLAALGARAAALESQLAAIPLVQSGTVAVQPEDRETVTSAEVIFPVPFRSTPAITVSANTSVPGTVVEVSYGSPSKTGCLVYMYRTSATSTSVSWIAVES